MRCGTVAEEAKPQILAPCLISTAMVYRSVRQCGDLASPAAPHNAQTPRTPTIQPRKAPHARAAMSADRRQGCAADYVIVLLLPRLSEVDARTVPGADEHGISRSAAG